MFQQALALARYSRSPIGVATYPDEQSITRAVWERHRGTGDIVFADVANNVKRALAANRLGRQMTDSPNASESPRAREYGRNLGIDRRRGEFEYRVVVRGEGDGHDFETLVMVRSKVRLSGQQVIDRATDVFMEADGLHRSYRTEIGQLGPTPTTQAWIVAASRYGNDR